MFYLLVSDRNIVLKIKMDLNLLLLFTHYERLHSDLSEPGPELADSGDQRPVHRRPHHPLLLLGPAQEVHTPGQRHPPVGPWQRGAIQYLICNIATSLICKTEVGNFKALEIFTDIFKNSYRRAGECPLLSPLQ